MVDFNVFYFSEKFSLSLIFLMELSIIDRNQNKF